MMLHSKSVNLSLMKSRLMIGGGLCSLASQIDKKRLHHLTLARLLLRASCCFLWGF